MMRRLDSAVQASALAHALLFVAAFAAFSAGAGELVVSPEGLTPHEALAKIRAAKASGDRSAWTVLVKAGEYQFAEPLVFTPEDSGETGAPVRWIGEYGAVFSGGRRIIGWRDAGGGVWEAPVPNGADGRPAFFESLYVNGRRAVRAHLPREGHFHIDKWRQEELKDGSGAVTGYVQRATVREQGLEALSSLSPAALAATKWRAFVLWTHESRVISAYDGKTGEIAICGSAMSRIPNYRPWKGNAANYFMLENVAAGFSEPGEWLYDADALKVKYRPLPGEDLGSAAVIAPVQQLVSLVRFEGDPDGGRFVHDVEFEGIGFTATRGDGEVAPNGAVNSYGFQAAAMSGATVSGEGLHRVRFARCRVFGTENYAFHFGDGSVSNAIVSCEIVDAGAGGVWLGNGKGNLLLWQNPSKKKSPNAWDAANCLPTERLVDASPRAVRFNVIDDNLIRHCGRVAPSACGIILTHAADTKVTHNEIEDLFYTGISVGWTWGYWGSYAQRNEISFNRIVNIGQGRMADMGGIYTLGASFGTVVTNNVIMHVNSSSYGGWGMYNDEGSEGVRWENNLVVDTSTDSYHIHFGRSNEVVNCVLVGSRGSVLAVSRMEAHRQVAFRRNVVVWPNGPAFRSGNRLVDGTAQADFDGNLFWSEDGVTELNGLCRGTVADPKFVDAAAGDWRLRPDSPALKLGFRPWDYSLSGRRRRAERTVEATPDTFAAALADVRARHGEREHVTLRLAPGDYRLDEPLKLTTSDSHLAIVSAEPGRARFVRGERATPGWVVECAAGPLPDAEGFARVRPHLPLFFYDGKWAVEARWPNEGYAEFTNVVESGVSGRVLNSVMPDNPTGPGAFEFASDRPARWNFDEGVWLCGYFSHDWAYERVRAAGFDAGRRVVSMAAAATYGIGSQTWSNNAGRRFFACGVRAELDASGEFFFDRKTRRVDFIAPPGMREFVAVTRPGGFLEAEGVDDLRIDGVVFEYALEGLVFRKCRGLAVEGCTVRNVGGNALRIDGGENCRVSKCAFAGIGLTCCIVSGGDRRRLKPAGHEIADCEFSDFARVNRTYESAVKLHGCGNRVLRNRMHDAPHSAIFYGGNDHLVSSNEIWNLLVETQDAGAVYTGRDPTSRGNVVSFNYVHDCGVRGRKMANVMAFYLDDCDAGDLVVSNRVVNVPRGLLIGGGQDNRAVGNSFERCDIGLSIDDRGVYETEKWDSVTDASWQITRKALEMPIFEEPWKSRYPLMATYLVDSPREPRHVEISGNIFRDCALPIEYYLKGASSREAIAVHDNVIVGADGGE